MNKKIFFIIIMIVIMTQSLWSFDFESKYDCSELKKNNSKDFHPYFYKTGFGLLYPEMLLAWEEASTLNYNVGYFDTLDEDPNLQWTISYNSGKISEINENMIPQSPFYAPSKILFEYSDIPEITSPIQILEQRLYSGEWVDYYKVSLNYDESGRLINASEELYSFNTWVGVYRYNYTYEDNHLLSVFKELFDPYDLIWINDTFSDLEWDGYQINNMVFKSWEGDSWVNSISRSFTYEIGDTLRCTILDRNWSVDHWNNKWKWVIEETNHQLISRFDFQALEPDYTSFNNVRKEFFTYNESGQLTEEDVWMAPLGTWIHSFQVVYSYSPSQNDQIPNANYTHLAVYPNPFNPTTTIHYSVPKQTDLVIQIYNIKGQLVKTLYNDHQTVGTHLINWDGTDQNNSRISSGTYLVFMKSSEGVQTKKIVLLK